MNERQIADLLKKYRHLIEDYLELVNDNQKFADLILLLRELLSLYLSDLTKYFSAGDAHCLIVAYLQSVYTCADQFKENRHVLDKHHHNTTVRQHHLNNIVSTLSHTIEKLTPLAELKQLPEDKLEFIQQTQNQFSFLKNECVTSCQFIEKEMLELNYITSNLLNITRRMEDAKGPSPLPELTENIDVTLALIQEMESLICTHISEHRRRLRLGLNLNNLPNHRYDLALLREKELELQEYLQRRAQEERELQRELEREEQQEKDSVETHGPDTEATAITFPE